MEKYLIKTVETYRFQKDEDVQDFLNTLKKDHHFELAKSSVTKKCTKAKGEIVDEWIRVEVTKVFNDEKEPETIVNIKYNYDSLTENNFEEDNEDV